MPRVTREQLDRAKKIDLLTYLQSHEPEELVRLSYDTYSTRSHDSLKISNGMWCQWSTGIGGRSALDYLIKIRGMSLPDAVLQIISEAAVRPVYAVPRVKNIPKEFVLPERSESCERAIRYLTGRGIDRMILLDLIKQGRIYEDSKYHNAVFVGVDKTGKPKYAMLRATNSSPFMIEVGGSDKRNSFSLIPDEKGEIHVFESAIDALSFLTLEKRSGKNWQSLNVLSLSGVTKQDDLPLSLRQVFSDYPDIRKVILHLDNDTPGREAAMKIIAALPTEYESTDRPPPVGKDYNDYLISTLKSKNRKDLVI